MTEKLPVKAAYSFGKLARAIQKEFEIFEESRKKLIDRYCARDENGKPIIESNIYKMADEAAFGKEFNELANIEVEIKFDAIPVDKLGDANVSPAVILGMEKFIIES